MSNIRSLRKAFPGTAWKIAFAEALLQLQPAMNPDAADEASDEAFIRLEHLAPCAAARAWVDARRHPAGAAPLATFRDRTGAARTAAI